MLLGGPQGGQKAVKDTKNSHNPLQEGQSLACLFLCDPKWAFTEPKWDIQKALKSVQMRSANQCSFQLALGICFFALFTDFGWAEPFKNHALMQVKYVILKNRLFELWDDFF